MRWIDIYLPEPGTHQEFDTHLASAREKYLELEEIQSRDGLDNVSVVRHLGSVGEELFRAVTALDPQVFRPEGEAAGIHLPDLEDPTHDDLMGFHLVVPPETPHVPWHCLHNGLDFLLVQHPVVTSDRPAEIPQGPETRPWMQRLMRAGFLVDEKGNVNLPGTLDQLRPEDLASPECLFVPGHTDDKIRRMIRREGEAIEAAIKGTNLNRTLARLHVPSTPVTPTELSKLSLTYQAIHFAGPVSQTSAEGFEPEPDWMDAMVSEISTPDARELEDAMGIEGEVLGVDPITSLLDDIGQRYEQTQLAGGYAEEPVQRAEGSATSQHKSGSRNPSGSGTPWLLEDGPVEPENLGKAGGVPPLIYSNSYRALPDLGQRFLSAGASTFIGPAIPLFSRPARIFSAYCYQALGDGWCAGAAVWKASANCRQELGKEHPAWLSYGMHGYGSLSLQYL